MNHLSLFSGIGGLDLAAEWAGFTTVGFVERDKFCQRVLAKHWPGVPIWDDVCNVTTSTFADAENADVEACRDKGGRPSSQFRELHSRNGVDIISGGFPCQPHSVAGKRLASADERDLWGECARIVGEFRPRWAVFENVPGLLSSEGGSFFARVVGDLAAMGYAVGWAIYGAVDVGAPHRRDRVFIIANRNGIGFVQRPEKWQSYCLHGQIRKTEAENGEWIGQHGTSQVGAMADANDAGSQGRECGGVPERTGERIAGHGSAWRTGPDGQQWQSEPAVGRVANGISRRVDRLRALGNAVVPQHAYPIFRAIAEIEGIVA